MLEEEARLTKVSEKWLVNMHMFLFFYMVFIYICVGLIINQKIISKSTGLNYYKYHIEFEPFPENIGFKKMGHGSLLQLNHSLQMKFKIFNSKFDLCKVFLRYLCWVLRDLELCVVILTMKVFQIGLLSALLFPEKITASVSKPSLRSRVWQS